MNCSKCGVEYDDSYRFCPNCGTTAAKMTEEGEEIKQIECLNCKTTFDSSFGFCPNCGAAVKKEKEESQKTRVTPQTDEDLSGYVFLLLAANIFTAFTVFISVIAVDESDKGSEVDKFSIFDIAKGLINSIKNYGKEYWDVKSYFVKKDHSAFSEYFWEIVAMVVIGIAAIVCAVFVLRAIKDFCTKEDSRETSLSMLKNLFVSSIAAVVQLGMFEIYLRLLTDEYTEGVSYTIWGYLLAAAAIISTIASYNLMKSNGCFSNK